MTEEEIWKELQDDGVPEEFICSSDKRRERLNICEGCLSYTKLKFCSECSCFMPLKSWITIKKCPLGKW